MRIYYKNHLNEEVDLDSKNIILQYHELLNYSWNADTSNGKISSFYRESATIPIKVTVTADTEETFREVIENFYSIVEKDVLNRIPGKLYVGEQYMSCYISGDIKSDVFLKVFIQVKNLTVVTDNPFWIKEKKISYPIFTGAGNDNFLEYPYDCLYDYTSKQKGISALNNDHYADANFKMTIYGPVVDPIINIGNYPYKVDTTVEENEYLTIDGTKNTVERTLADGTIISEYNKRSFENSVFRPIPPGNNSVLWSGDFGWDITLYQERSEPKW